MTGLGDVATLVHAAPWVVLACAAVVFPVLFFITAPYGRHTRSGWGPTISSRVAWVVMESPSVFVFTFFWWTNADSTSPLVLTLGALWLAHYLQRTFVYPLLLRGTSRREPMVVAAMAIVFNLLNASGNGAAFRARPFDAAFVIGAALFVAGYAINLHSDAVLRNLRKPGETGYRVPHGGLFSLIAAPNYFGELVEWLGFTIAAQTTAAWAFAIFTFANLAPRAWAHRRWYRAQFADYPPSRRALVPFVW